jgi:hypothetical protein
VVLMLPRGDAAMPMLPRGEAAMLMLPQKKKKDA